MSQSDPLDWRGPVPVSQRFNDPYFSLEDGLAETRHVFLSGNDLPARFCPGFHIAELGFGTGLNFLAARGLWRRSGQSGTLRFTSFEAYPMAPEDLARALAAFKGLDARDLTGADFPHRITGPGFELTVIIGDARETLPAWDGVANAWFLDGFAPARNPELWEAPLMEQVYARTAPGGSFATYTAAGAVRRALTEAGFDVTRQPGHGRKRHMTTGRKPL